jgi:hypothetical protein
MFPVPRHALQLESEWAIELSAYLGCSLEMFQKAPIKFMRFPTETLRIELMDGSVVEFKCAFHLVNEAQKSIAVFTEHCGHHLFPYHEARVFRQGVLCYEQRNA